jgi:hypothetical protein
MYFFRVRDAAPTLGIQLLSLVVAIAVLSPSAYPQTLGILKTIYDHAATLSSPHDDDAMRAYQALLRHAATGMAKDAGSEFKAKPRATELHTCGGPSPEASLSALKRLKDVKLADLAQWGGAAGNLDHPNNRWTLCA